MFRREALTRLGQGRILTTAGLFVLAIRANQLTIDQAHAIKLVLETNRFRMAFASFRDIIRVDSTCGLTTRPNETS